MKKTTFILSIILISISLFSQHTFSLTLNEEDNEYNNYFLLPVETENEYYIIHKRSRFIDFSDYKRYSSILKISKEGEILNEWKLVNSDSSISINGFIINKDKVFVFAGERKNSFTVWELDASFNTIKEKKYVFSNFGNRIIYYLSPKYNFNKTNSYVTGSLYDTIAYHPKEAFIMKFSQEGDSLDTKIIQRDNEEFTSINIQSQNSFLKRDSITFSTIEGEMEHYIYIMNNNMEIIDSSSVSILGQYGEDMLNGEVEILSNDTIVYACDYQDDVYKTRLSTWDTNFNKLNEVLVGKQDSATYASSGNLEISKDGNIFLGQKLFPSSNPFPGPFNSWMVLSKFGKNLNLIWEKYYGGDCFYKLISITATEDGGCLLAGDKWFFDTDNSVRAYLLKVDEFGNGPASSINKQDKIKVSELIIYPNPSKSNLNIRTAVQRIGGEFKMYDISGKQVLMQQITQSITQVNTEHLPIGTYIYKYVHEGKEIESGKWIKE